MEVERPVQTSKGSVGNPIHGNIWREKEKKYRREQEVKNALAKEQKGGNGPPELYSLGTNRRPASGNETAGSSNMEAQYDNPHNQEAQSRETAPPIHSYNVFNKKSRNKNNFQSFEEFLQTGPGTDQPDFQVKVVSQRGGNLELTSKFGGHTYTIQKDDLQTISQSFGSIAKEAKRVISDTTRFRSKLDVDMYVICIHDKDGTKLLKGYLILVCFYSQDPTEPVVFNIYDVVTVPQFRRKGVMLELFYKTRDFMSAYTQNKGRQQHFLQFGVLKSNTGALQFYRKLITRPGFLYVLHIESVKTGDYPSDLGESKFPYPFNAQSLGSPYLWLTFSSENMEKVHDLQRAENMLVMSYLNNLKHDYMKVIELVINKGNLGKDLRLIPGEKHPGYPAEDTAGHILSMQTETGFSCGLVGPGERGQYTVQIDQYVPGSTTEFSTPMPYEYINFSTATTTPADSPTVKSLGNGHVHPNICYNLYGCILGLPSSGDLINAVYMYMNRGLPFTLVIAREGLYVITFKEEHALELGIGTSSAAAAAERYGGVIRSKVTSSQFYEKIFTFYQFLLEKEQTEEGLVRVRFIAKGDTKEYNCDEWRQATSGILNYYKQMTVKVYNKQAPIGVVDYSQENINSSSFDASFEQVMDLIEKALGTKKMNEYVEEHIKTYLNVYYNTFIPQDQPAGIFTPQSDFVHIALLKWQINGNNDRLLPYYIDYLNLSSFREQSAKNMSIVDNYELGNHSGNTNSKTIRGTFGRYPARMFNN
jgi:hypothetical protein